MAVAEVGNRANIVGGQWLPPIVVCRRGGDDTMIPEPSLAMLIVFAVFVETMLRRNKLEQLGRFVGNVLFQTTYNILFGRKKKSKKTSIIVS